MAIQMRRGIYSRFDPNKLLPGEFAVVTSGDESVADGMSVYLCFAAGTTKRLSTYAEMAADLATALAALEEEFTGDVTAATAAATSAASAATASKNAADVATEAALLAAQDATEAAAEARGAVSPDLSLYMQWITDDDGDEILSIVDTER